MKGKKKAILGKNTIRVLVITMSNIIIILFIVFKYIPALVTIYNPARTSRDFLNYQL